jgi:phosphoribosylaminoimidazolecarboxamide formyltransferase / IMP cyclohydrolase
MRALISVYDKSGVVDLARDLVALGWEILSTGGTRAALVAAGIPVTEVASVTGFPEILGGRVKTLHPLVHGGILARRDLPEHTAQMRHHQIEPIDMVVGNLYPFAETLERGDVSDEDVLEQIDVGGPAMLRAAAKNYQHVLALVDPADYEPVLASLRDGGVDAATRRRLAARAFQHVASYDTQIASYLRGEDDAFPEELTVSMRKAEDLRYGENPHQQAAFYVQSPSVGLSSTLAGGRQLHGKALSYINLLDIDAALACVRDYAAPCAAIVKHATPCGLACGETIVDAYRRALECDPMSAFGGAVALNRPVDLALGQVLAEQHFDDMVAPRFDDDALALLMKKKNLRIYEVDFSPVPPWAAGRNPTLKLDVRRVSGGFLVQTPDRVPEDGVSMKTVTEREPTFEEVTDMLFAWRAVKHVKSNAIVLASRLALVGIGAGQVSRVDAVDIALRKARGRAIGSVLASDAYFPFPDGPELAAHGGVTAIIQPGGSIRDSEIIREANRHHMAMVFTGTRHFRH